jgi:(2Fe-2S) ferredoxin
MGKDLTKVTNTVFICNGGTCKKSGAEENTRELRCAIKMAGLHEITHTIKTLCQGQCENAPVLFLNPEGIWYKRMTAETIDEFVKQKLASSAGFDDHTLFKDGWNTMFPVKTIDPKTHDDLSHHDDDHIGYVYGALIYPWEHNVYPLLKEIFQIYRQSVVIYHLNKSLNSSDFQVDYKDGKALINGNIAGENLEVVMSATRESEYFLYKVSKIKLYRTPDGLQGIYVVNARQGIFLRVEWRTDNNFWNHLVDNYVMISG